MTNLQSRLDATVTSNTLMKEELGLTKTALTKAQEEIAMLRGASQSNMILNDPLIFKSKC